MSETIVRRRVIPDLTTVTSGDGLHAVAAAIIQHAQATDRSAAALKAATRQRGAAVIALKLNARLAPKRG